MVHGSFTAGKTAQEPSLGELPQDIIFEIVTRLDVRSKCRALSVRRDWADFLALPHHWGQLVFRSASEQRGLRAADLLRLAQRSKQSLQALCFCRSSKSEAQQTADRVQQGWKHCPPSPVQLTLPPLAGCLANLAHLSLDERTSCLGGMSDQMAALLAQHAPGLVTLDLFFVPYSRASEMFTDEGMCTLAEGCTQLQSLTLHNTGITNRALYSLAHHSRALRDLEIEGYSEFITNTGVAVVAQARPGLRRCHLGGRLLKVGNSAIESIARFCPDLESLSVSGGATDDALVILSSGACLSRLQTLDLRSCHLMTQAGVEHFAATSSLLHRCLQILIPVSFHAMAQRRPQHVEFRREALNVFLNPTAPSQDRQRRYSNGHASL